MRTISGNRGNVGITGLAAFLGAVMFFSVLYGFYTGVSDVGAKASAERTAADVAAVIDSVGSSPFYCKASYETPDKLSGREYLLRISGNLVTVSLSNPAYNGTAIFFANISNELTAPGGADLTITKNNTVFEVT
jgi:hypothetical protein